MINLADDARVIAGATVGPWKDAERYGAVIADAVPWMVDETERKEYGGAVICESTHPHIGGEAGYPVLCETCWEDSTPKKRDGLQKAPSVD